MQGYEEKSSYFTFYDYNAKPLSKMFESIYWYPEFSADKVISLNEFERIIKFRQNRGEDVKIFYHRGKTFGYVRDVYAKLKRTPLKEMKAGLSGFGRNYDPSDGLNHPYNRLSGLNKQNLHRVINAYNICKYSIYPNIYNKTYDYRQFCLHLVFLSNFNYSKKTSNFQLKVFFNASNFSFQIVKPSVLNVPDHLESRCSLEIVQRYAHLTHNISRQQIYGIGPKILIYKALLYQETTNTEMFRNTFIPSFQKDKYDSFHNPQLSIFDGKKKLAETKFAKTKSIHSCIECMICVD